MTYDEAIKRIHAICSSVAYGANPTMAVVHIMDITGPLVEELAFHREFGQQVVSRMVAADVQPDGAGR